MAKTRETAQSSSATPARVSAAWQALTKALFDDYRPERHYMRGPGPKWHEKHAWTEMSVGSPAASSGWQSPQVASP